MPDDFPRGRPASLSHRLPVLATVADMALICSAKGCAQPAVWALLWNNPKIHAPERRKTWLACEEHRQSLSDFLQVRGFLRQVGPAQAVEEEPGAED